MSTLTQPAIGDSKTTLLRKIAQSLYEGALEERFEEGINAEKLGGAWSVGTEFHVTDGFVVNGSGDPIGDGLYFANGTENSRTKYSSTIGFKIVFDPESGDTGIWVQTDSGDGVQDNTALDVANPWDAAWGAITLTHPAVQILVALPASDEANWVNV